MEVFELIIHFIPHIKVFVVNPLQPSDDWAECFDDDVRTCHWLGVADLEKAQIFPDH